ncbi:sugar ABC transporter substrate-binding protein [Streptomyces sp. CB02923]|uniref:ABC transporter substrate-binding protein n=1 Tax=Streptomyces sp. CB02923 TaxID=1718985 RepID=UPI000938A708|nr:sugar ABC transporter substrate-binding protein [Streptomyces sp. CB02923]OKI01028.1 sugar ABC transporter substrate-binding protein [Streptomyces sp. CB02923]
MRTNRLRTAVGAALAAALTTLTAGCGGGSPTGAAGGGNTDPRKLTYWASNQSSSGIEQDKKILAPELEKFAQRTGITVELEVVPWADLLNRILAAAASGQGPDVLNIGNTWSASLQAGGSLLPFDDRTLAKVGGKDRFAPSALAATGARGKAPAAVPLYSLAYGLYYNKQRFAEAGIGKPPATWAELAAAGRKLTGNGRYGLAVEGGNPVENAHHAFILGKQHGADFFDARGRPTFDGPAAVQAVKQYVDLMAKDRIAAPGNAEYGQNQSVKDFATGKAAMLLWQAAGSSLKVHGMRPDAYGVARMPLQNTADRGERAVTSMVAGINLAVFRGTDNLDGALKFVKFMTSTPEQKALNSAYGSLPPVKEAQADPAFAGPEQAMQRQALDGHAAPLPQVPDESQFETLVGTAVKELFADAAAGRPVTTESVRRRLTKAQQQMAE